ncbi:MAG: hypothetical protein P8Y18_01700 [Candidatus Bathyarchaeota archaeon]
MSSAELIVRGLMDKLLDDQLRKEDLTLLHDAFVLLIPSEAIRGDLRDAAFGYILGTIQSNFLTLFRTIFNRNPNKEEMEITIDVYQNNIN